MEFSSISSFTAFVCYSVATLSILSRLFHPKGPNLIVTLIFACLAIIFHALSSSQFLFTHHTLNFSLPNVVSLVSLIITLVISLAALRFKVNLLLDFKVLYSEHLLKPIFDQKGGLINLPMKGTDKSITTCAKSLALLILDMQ